LFESSPVKWQHASATPPQHGNVVVVGLTPDLIMFTRQISDPSVFKSQIEELATNGVRDIVAVRLDRGKDYAGDAAFVEKLLSLVPSNVPTVAVYTAFNTRKPGAADKDIFQDSTLQSSSFASSSDRATVVRSVNFNIQTASPLDPIYNTFFTPTVLMVLLVAAFAGFMFLCAICAFMQVQTATQFFSKEGQRKIVSL